MVYLSVLESDFKKLQLEGEVKLNKNYFCNFTDEFEIAIVNGTQLSKKFNEKFVVLTIEMFIKTVSFGFYLRGQKSIISLNNNDYKIMGYYLNSITDDDILKFEAGMELFISFDNILSEKYISSLYCADETDIYNHINIKGIEEININTVMDKKRLEKYLCEMLSEMSQNNNFSYNKL